uniref:Uncharacterized protein n=1 Tax=Zea mays TaxID=4577 RepID=C0HE27_MAIZE|nr:unknown [Zea mays]
MQQVFKQQQLHIKEVGLLLVFKGHLDFRLAKQLPRQALQWQQLVIRLGQLGRARCLVLRLEALVFRVDIDRTSLASAGRGSFMWFCIRMAFKSILVPNCCGRLPALEFYNRI